MTRDNITSNVRPIDPERLRRIFGEREPIRFSRNQPPTLGERIADALSSPRFVLFYLGFFSGAMFCCGTLIFWERVL